MRLLPRKKRDDTGQVSQPEGDGPVSLEDRTAPGGQGSPDTNQGRAEPVEGTPARPDPLPVPDLSAMSAGAAPSQAPSHPAAAPLAPPGAYGGGDAGDAPKGLGGPGAQPDQTRPEVDSTTSTGRAHGPVQPEQRTTGEAHRAGGLQGTTPEGESIETDTEAGAARMGDDPAGGVAGVPSGHGDPGPSPGVGDAAAPGTSETQPEVQGVRLPES